MGPQWDRETAKPGAFGDRVGPLVLPRWESNIAGGVSDWLSSERGSSTARLAPLA
jgi:hypothetical protein